MGKRKMSSVYRTGEWVVVAVIKLVSLRCHSGVSHDDVGIIVQMQMYFVSSVRTFVNCELAIVIKGVSGSVCASFLALLGKNTKQLLTLLRI